MKNIAVFGASGAIGSSFVNGVVNEFPDARVTAFSRKVHEFNNSSIDSHAFDLTDERSIENAAQSIVEPLDMVIVATGMLHGNEVGPEKSLRDLSFDKFEKLFAVNTIGPALIVKHFVSKLNRKNKSVFAVLSARVGSIGDNRLGGWYAYRASKAALNMIIKTSSVEVARRNKNAVLIGLHPGTVDSRLSAPFQGNVPDGKLFSPAQSTDMMLDVIKNVSTDDTGYVFDYNGKRIEF